MTKKDLRTEIKNIIGSLSEDYKKEAGKAIADAVVHSPSFINAKSVFVYVSTATEPDTSLIISKALKTGKRVFVPKCLRKGFMIPVEITPATRFTSGYMGISEPEIYDESTNIKAIDLSVIPCITANEKGERLGHGAGFYDRFLQNVKTEKMCLCFGKLISSEIPTDEHDIRMDWLITENNAIKI